MDKFTGYLWFDILIFLIGLVLVVKGADLLTSGATTIARKFKVSTLIIGLTIVAFGTSLPELVVSATSSLKGNCEMALGNIVGSNIFNTMAIVGVTALFCPIVCNKKMLIRDIPVNIFVTVLLILMIFVFDEVGILTRVEGIILLFIFAIYLAIAIYSSVKNKTENTDKIEEKKVDETYPMILYIIGGLAALIIGGDWFVDGASGIARKLGVSDAVIALTIVSAGTSFPELATSIMAAKKGDTDMAIGNVVGSNIFNIMLILGVASAINPVEAGNVNDIDFIFLGLSITLLSLFCYFGKKHKINRWHGLILTIAMIAYYVYLVMSACSHIFCIKN